MTELEAYLNGIVFEENEDEEDDEEESGAFGEDAVGFDEDPDDDNDDEDDDNDDEDDDEEGEEDNGEGDYALSTIKAVSKSVASVKSKLEHAIRAISGQIQQDPRKWPPFIKKEERDARKQAKSIVKLKSRHFNSLRRKVRDKSLRADFDKERTKITNAQKELSKILSNLEIVIKAAWGKFWANLIAKIGIPGLIVILVVGIIFIALIVVASIFSQTPDDIEKNGLQSPFGATGANFYGVRLIYADKEQEKTQLISDYGNIVSASVNYIEQNNTDIELNITLEIPENYNFNNIETDDEMAEEFALIKSIATAVYTLDQGQAPAADITPEGLFAGVKYFGINTELHTQVVDAIWNYINGETKYYTVKEGASIDEAKIKTEITSVVDDNTIRTEKLFVEDKMFASADDSLKMTEAKDYRAMIYLPKANTTFNYFYIKTYGVPDEQLENFKVYIQNGDGEPVQLSRENITDNGQNYYISKDNLGIAVAGIGEQVPDAITGSLAELGKLTNANELLTQAKDEEGNDIANVFTYANFGMMIKFESPVDFMFVDLEIKTE